MCLQSTFAATIRAIVTADQNLAASVVHILRHAPVFPLLHRQPTNHNQTQASSLLKRLPVVYRGSSGAHPAWGEEETKKTPSLRPATSPSGAQAQPRSAGGKAPAAQPSSTNPLAFLLARANAAADTTLPSSRTIPALPPRVRSPALSSPLASLLERVS